MFQQNKGTHLAFLRVKWRNQDASISRPPNKNNYYIQIARHHTENKLFIPGNDHGHGFQFDSNNNKSMTNILKQINTQNLTTACRVKGLCPIKGCPQASWRIEPGAAHKVVKTTALDEPPDYDNGSIVHNDNNNLSMTDINDAPMMETNDKEDNNIHKDPQTEETTVTATTQDTMVTEGNNTMLEKIDNNKQESNQQDEKSLLETENPKLSEPQRSQ